MLHRTVRVQHACIWVPAIHYTCIQKRTDASATPLSRGPCRSRRAHTE